VEFGVEFLSSSRLVLFLKVCLVERVVIDTGQLWLQTSISKIRIQANAHRLNRHLRSTTNKVSIAMGSYQTLTDLLNVLTWWHESACLRV